MCLCSARRTEQEGDATLLLDTFCVVHFFVSLIGATLHVLRAILITPKALMVILVPDVSKPPNLFPDCLWGVAKHLVSRPKAPPLKAYSPIEDLDKQAPMLMFMKLDFPLFFTDFRLPERRGGTLLK